MTDCACKGRYPNDNGWTASHSAGKCTSEFNKDDYVPPLPNLLDGTTLFMQKARQLESVGFGDQDSPVRTLRRNLLIEEFAEWQDGEYEDDLVETVDGLLDIIVIAWGSLLAYVGEDKAKAAAAEVVRSNLAKVIGEGLPIFREDGKVIKPPGWTTPDIKKAIQ